MNASTIYSIAHGNKKLENFINELKSFKIFFLPDIRLNPLSKLNPAFNKSTLETSLKEHNIVYVFLGDKLDGLPTDSTCYDTDGKVVCDRIKEKDFYQEGIKRLIRGNSKSVKLAIMCSEAKPEECHRSKLAGQELLKSGISVNPILSSKLVKSLGTVMTELTKGLGAIDLFGNLKEFVSRKSYCTMQFFTLGGYKSEKDNSFRRLSQNSIGTFSAIRQHLGVRGTRYSFVNSNRLQSKLQEMGSRYVYTDGLAPTPEIRSVQERTDKQQKKNKKERTVLSEVFTLAYRNEVLSKFDFDCYMQKCCERKVQKTAVFCVETYPEACHHSLVAKKLEELGFKINLAP